MQTQARHESGAPEETPSTPQEVTESALPSDDDLELPASPEEQESVPSSPDDPIEFADDEEPENSSLPSLPESGVHPSIEVATAEAPTARATPEEASDEPGLETPISEPENVVKSDKAETLEKIAIYLKRALPEDSGGDDTLADILQLKIVESPVDQGDPAGTITGHASSTAESLSNSPESGEVDEARTRSPWAPDESSKDDAELPVRNAADGPEDAKTSRQAVVDKDQRATPFPRGVSVQSVKPDSETVTLKWDVPKTYSNGNPLDVVACYRLYYGYSPDRYDRIVWTLENSITLHGIYSGSTCYYSVLAVDIWGKTMALTAPVATRVDP